MDKADRLKNFDEINNDNKQDNQEIWIKRALEELGVRDEPGPSYSKRVVEYLKTTGLEKNNDEISWCSAFVNWCFDKEGIKGTNNVTARSWLKWGDKLDVPKQGCVVVLWRENIDSWKGHVGFFMGWEIGGRVKLLAGNQAGGVDWDEVCVSNFPKERILGYRWPSNH
jgi:uncharacterized protein (TIGR02594 family)